MAEQAIFCPYCGQENVIFIDISVPRQTYIEDCQVCCRAIMLSVSIDKYGEPSVVVRREDE